MKASVKRVSEEFKPVTLEMVFETKEELAVFRKMCGYQLTVPEAIFPSGDGAGKKRHMLTEVLTYLRGVLNAEFD